MVKKATREAYGEALAELGKINKDVIISKSKFKLNI